MKYNAKNIDNTKADKIIKSLKSVRYIKLEDGYMFVYLNHKDEIAIINAKNEILQKLFTASIDIY